MPRTKASQSKHDAKVGEIAQRLSDQGFDVQADVKGFPQPDTVGGRRPDVVAQKGKTREIHEVETLDSVDSARNLSQQKAFEQAANRSKNVRFKRTVVKK